MAPGHRAAPLYSFSDPLETSGSLPKDTNPLPSSFKPYVHLSVYTTHLELILLGNRCHQAVLQNGVGFIFGDYLFLFYRSGFVSVLEAWM